MVSMRSSRNGRVFKFGRQIEIRGTFILSWESIRSIPYGWSRWGHLVGAGIFSSRFRQTLPVFWFQSRLTGQFLREVCVGRINLKVVCAPRVPFRRSSGHTRHKVEVNPTGPIACYVVFDVETLAAIIQLQGIGSVHPLTTICIFMHQIAADDSTRLEAQGVDTCAVAQGAHKVVNVIVLNNVTPAAGRGRIPAPPY